jgi:hypothetical protein
VVLKETGCEVPQGVTRPAVKLGQPLAQKLAFHCLGDPLCLNMVGCFEAPAHVAGKLDVPIAVSKK